MTGLPTNDSTVHVRLYTRISSGWQSTDYTYTCRNSFRHDLAHAGVDP